MSLQGRVASLAAARWPSEQFRLGLVERSRMYTYGNHLTPGLTEVRSYAAFFTSFLAEGLRFAFEGYWS